MGTIGFDPLPYWLIVVEIHVGDEVQYGTVWYSMVQYGTVWYSGAECIWSDLFVEFGIDPTTAPDL